MEAAEVAEAMNLSTELPGLLCLSLSASLMHQPKAQPLHQQLEQLRLLLPLPLLRLLSLAVQAGAESLTPMCLA